MALRVTLITGRTINQGANLENKTSSDYMEATACCELNSNDIGLLGNPGSNVKVKTEYGEVVVRLKENSGNPDSIAFIPMGPWANAVVDPDTRGCGMPGFKGIQAEIEATDDKVLSMRELIAGYK
ncbi:formylmethanofuran dehydrogenase subunit D [Candidatus Methanoperedens nitroreducens]|uniref:Formylmethanofuran dehydrogenase subunit D n=1 Tax=Candidatus Methanoperedens nitratireducens TaxID=1392998 RepID=A0A062V6Q0_9EURY|nr:molybdopterin dinucleotide binding domain-containing protein [Candidatus Methanoperedens nitroreducens]KCZ72273.1 formylmethanofuran dehydrogenase subunit D [Candidatus Methanoperedens nitroreducens]MDJ1420739.1 molybdopterin dinucleotide binding domain-containing protein [Candidatus Methanoperedens sp.]